MKVVLYTENIFQSNRLRERIIKGIKNDLDDLKIDTWSYAKATGNYDIIYHNPQQYIERPEKNVLFRLEIDGTTLTAEYPDTNGTMYRK